MKNAHTLSMIALSLAAGVFSSAPVPPFSTSIELLSVATAALVFAFLLLVPILRHRRVALGAFVASSIPIRIISETLWEIWPSHLPRSFFVLTQFVGADGEGAYNTDTYQVYLIFMAGMLLIASLLQPNKPLKPTPGTDGAYPDVRSGAA